jgi:hypothetical protein
MGMEITIFISRILGHLLKDSNFRYSQVNSTRTLKWFDYKYVYKGRTKNNRQFMRNNEALEKT